MKTEPTDIVAYQQSDSVVKANSLITAKYRGSLLEAKVLYASLWAIQNRHMEEVDSGYEVTLRANELKELTHSNGGSFYESLQPVAESLMHRSVGIEKPDEDFFDYVNLISRCRYDHGVFSIIFSKDCKDLVLDVSKNYTTLPKLMMSFKSVYAFRLYEILKRYCYYHKDVPMNKRSNIFVVEKGIAELKLELGTVNAELDTVRRELKGKKTPNYERAVEKSPEELYKTYADFNRYVLKVAVKEINESSDMYVTYKPNRGGADRKTYSITFTMDLSKRDDKATEIESSRSGKKLSQDEKYDFHYEIRAMFDKEISFKEAESIAKAASYDMTDVKKAKDLLDKQGSVSNKVGWMIACIKGDYKMSGSSSKKNAFSDFPQNEYDYDELERILINN